MIFEHGAGLGLRDPGAEFDFRNGAAGSDAGATWSPRSRSHQSQRLGWNGGLRRAGRAEPLCLVRLDIDEPVNDPAANLEISRAGAAIAPALERAGARRQRRESST